MANAPDRETAFAPEASRNIVTEDLAFMLETMGTATAIDLDKLFGVRWIVKAALPAEDIYGSAYRTRPVYAGRANGA